MEIELTPQHKMLITKLHASGSDVMQAQGYAREIIKRNLFKKPWSRGHGYFHQGAYVTSLVVCYSRPFSTGRSGYRFPQRLIPYDDAEWDLHKRITSQRDEIYAHSDLAHWRIRPWKSDEFETITVGRPHYEISKEELELFLSMTAKLIGKIYARYEEVLQVYGGGKNIAIFPT